MFDHVLDDILVAIKTGKGLFPLIPDSPFPARSVVEALAYLVELGIVCLLIYPWISCAYESYLEHNESPSRHSSIRTTDFTVGPPGEIGIWR